MLPGTDHMAWSLPTGTSSQPLEPYYLDGAICNLTSQKMPLTRRALRVYPCHIHSGELHQGTSPSSHSHHFLSIAILSGLFQALAHCGAEPKEKSTQLPSVSLHFWQDHLCCSAPFWKPLLHYSPLFSHPILLPAPSTHTEQALRFGRHRLSKKHKLGPQTYFHEPFCHWLHITDTSGPKGPHKTHVSQVSAALGQLKEKQNLSCDKG